MGDRMLSLDCRHHKAAETSRLHLMVTCGCMCDPLCRLWVEVMVMFDVMFDGDV